MKTVTFNITHCGQCPFCEYDSNYGMSYNSGYDCKKTGKRLATDIGSEIQDLSKKEIPSSCPLEDKWGEPMKGRELQILKETARRQISNKPTTLNKKEEAK